MKEFGQVISLLDNARHYYIICTNLQGIYTYINQAYAKRFSHVNHHFVGQPSTVTMHPDDVPAVVAAGRQCLQDKNLLLPVTIRKHDGKGGYIFTQWEFKGMFDDNGVPEGVFCLGYDVTDFIAELSKKNLLLEDASFRQSHVLRRPVANIIGVVNLLKDYELPNEAADMLASLADDVLELDTIVRAFAADLRQ
jgi:hypothetical protein